LAAQGASVVQQLQPFGLNSIVASEWPGTALLGDTAIVHRFTYDADVVRILLKNSCRLFQWVQPGLPEDLCLLRASRDAWLVSVAHERDGYFFLDEPEASDLFAVVPELRSMTKMDEP